jgi:energy-coupling factor transporter ATP-binding protein EcfA2
MLLRFTVENHASLRDRQELSLIALDDHLDLAAHRVPGTKDQTLPVAGIFGANASGKSNVVDALAFVVHAVRASHQRWLPETRIPRRSFLLNEGNKRMPSEFSVDILIEGTRYQYGFSCDDRVFLKEWLVTFPEGHPRVLFRRTHGSPIKYGSHLGGPKKSIERLVRDNSLYLSAAATNDHEDLATVYRWFHHDCRIALDKNYHDCLRETLHLYNQDEYRDPLLDLLNYADLGISDIHVESRPLTCEARRHYAPFVKSPESDLDYVPDTLELEPHIKLMYRLKDRSAALPLEWESSGTKTWLSMVGPVLAALRAGRVLVVDGIDARMHPVLAGHLVKLFQDPETNANGAQLIFNGHNAGLLGPNVPARLRRDQVWLTEKSSQDGSTTLYPLTRYEVTEGLDNVERSYLKGRYGSVPFIDEALLANLSGDGQRGHA